MGEASSLRSTSSRSLSRLEATPLRYHVLLPGTRESWLTWPEISGSREGEVILGSPGRPYMQSQVCLLRGRENSDRNNVTEEVEAGMM